MTRTTIGFDDDLLRRLKRRAAMEGRTVQALANDLLRQAMAPRARTYALRLSAFAGEPAAGFDPSDRATFAAGRER